MICEQLFQNHRDLAVFVSHFFFGGGGGGEGVQNFTYNQILLGTNLSGIRTGIGVVLQIYLDH